MSATTGETGRPPTSQDSALRVRTRHAGAIPVIAVEGEVDLSTVESVRDAVHCELKATQPQGLILDLTGVTFLCSTGLQLLVDADRRMQDNGGALCVVGARREVLRPLQLTGLDEHLHVYPTLEEALAQLPTTE
ncbi:anti-sigma B factor antagonist [Amycolatopsis marina]|uniref:Anti-sigma factor antagonist n=1 Tax=Amycolatopsis marina TaxID=490629 RepID=A0A1I1BJK9_9PSEU|nr:anti-sigma factor antagonist [Amycolatopsis marina]SFB50579.1 anti-sigma B factor antagonist [Amycolatopsis marina]